MTDRSVRKELPGRLLRLLTLLQSRRTWSGGELAARLGVTERTLRRDVDRLRELDYRVEGTTGSGGGYRLGSGQRLPPLVLDDDEAVAVALGLVTAKGGGIHGIEESSMRALAKVEQVLPARLRPRIAALGGAADAVRDPGAPHIDPGALALLAGCCRDREMVSFDYRGRDGTDGARRVEPYGLVTVSQRWYLLAYAPERAGWRTFRVDRIAGPTRTHRSFSERELPDTDAAHYLARSFSEASYRYTAWITVGLSAAEVLDGIHGPIPGDIEDRGPRDCTVRLTADTASLVVQYVLAVAALDVGFRLEAPAEITERLRAVTERFTDGVAVAT